MVDRWVSLVAALAVASMAQAQPVPEPPRAGIPAEGSSGATSAEPAAAPSPPAEGASAGRHSVLETRIEQVKRGNRVSEVRVTGAEGQPRYTMDNPEGRPPSTIEGSRTGLSPPNFLNIEF